MSGGFKFVIFFLRDKINAKKYKILINCLKLQSIRENLDTASVSVSRNYTDLVEKYFD